MNKIMKSRNRLTAKKITIPVALAVIGVAVFSGLKPVLSESADSNNESAASDSATSEGTNKYNYQSIEGVSDNNPGNSASISGSEVSVNVDENSKSETSKSNTEISIDISTKNNSSTNEESTISEQPSISINGEEIEIPENGRLRETIKDENSTTRLRTNIDSDGSSSISINTSNN